MAGHDDAKGVVPHRAADRLARHAPSCLELKLPRYLAVFTAANAAGLAVLSAAAALLGLL